MILSNVGTAVDLYPIARRQNGLLAIGYVAARIIECVFLAGGIIFVLGVVSVRQDSPDAADLAVSLAALKDWTFLFGPGLIVPFGNGLLLGYLMYRSGLVPRRMAWLGLIGGPLLLIGQLGVLFDVWEPPARRASWSPPSSSGSCRLASTPPSGDSGGMLRFFSARTGTFRLPEPASPPLSGSAAVYESVCAVTKSAPAVDEVHASGGARSQNLSSRYQRPTCHRPPRSGSPACATQRRSPASVAMRDEEH